MSVIVPVASNSTQVYTFLYSVLVGMFIGLIYDIFRIKRKLVKTAAFFIYIEDLLFWIITAFIMFAFLFYINDGEIRIYIYLGVITGIILYSLLFSKLIIKCSVAIFNFIGRVVKFIIHILSFPFKIIYKILSVPARFIMVSFQKFYRFLKRTARILVYKMSVHNKIFKNVRKKT